jgi:fructokinase
MSEKKRTLIGLGEVLWDLFPQGKHLGGAPANFAYMTNLLGDEGLVASRIGSDALGEQVCHALGKLSLQTTFLQIDPEHPTGTVHVEVDRKGQPKFEIAPEVAWDFLEWTSRWRALAERADAICFGSLAQRSAKARATIRSFLRAAKNEAVRIFDVNLRQLFYSKEILEESAELADIMKLNHDELPVVIQLLGGPTGDERASAKWLQRKFALRLVCVTRGEDGSLLVTDSAVDEHPGFRVPVADTVGSGDAFAAALVHHFLWGASLSTMNEAANRLGAWVASQRGATPGPDNQILEKVRGNSP